MLSSAASNSGDLAYLVKYHNRVFEVDPHDLPHAGVHDIVIRAVQKTRGNAQPPASHAAEETRHACHRWTNWFTPSFDGTDLQRINTARLTFQSKTADGRCRKRNTHPQKVQLLARLDTDVNAPTLTTRQDPRWSTRLELCSRGRLVAFSPGRRLPPRPRQVAAWTSPTSRAYKQRSKQQHEGDNGGAPPVTSTAFLAGRQA